MAGDSVKVMLAILLFIIPVSGAFYEIMADVGTGRTAKHAVKRKSVRKGLTPGEVRSLKKRGEREARRHEEEMRRREYEMMRQSQQRGMGGSPRQRQDTDLPNMKQGKP